MDCIFCKIVAGEIPCAKVWENDHFLAFLDLYPNRPGMTLVIPKQHYGSEIFSMDDQVLSEYFLAAKTVVNILKKGMNVERVGMVVEGLDVDHAHIKLYPFTPGYEGFSMGTSGTKQADINELNILAEQLRASKS